MLGRVPGYVTSQGEVLGERLARDGHDVRLTSHFPGRLRRLADSVSTIARVRHDVDVAIVMVFSGAGFALAHAQASVARASGVPVVLHLHGGNLPSFCDRNPRWAKRLLGAGHPVVAPSTYLARSLRRWADIRVIPNVIDLDDYAFVERRSLAPRLLWMRTFHSAYRPDLAVSVLEHVRRRFPGATLTMAGQEKGMGAAVRAMVREKGLERAVRFPGFLDPSAKRREFAAHDIFLNTNRIDNMPVSLLEAGAFGLPIVATDVGGVRDLVGDGAMLVPEGDALRMTAAVETLLGDPELSERLSREGRRMAERSAWPAIRPMWKYVFDSTLGREAR